MTKQKCKLINMSRISSDETSSNNKTNNLMIFASIDSNGFIIKLQEAQHKEHKLGHVS